MMNTETLATRVGADWNDIARKLGAKGLDASQIESVRTVPAAINNRLTRSLGRVKVSRATGPKAIELSGQLVARGEASEIVAVFLHEVAHLAAGFLQLPTGRWESAHGYIWQGFARALGVSTSASAETSYTVERPGLKTVAICSACGFELQKTRRLNRRRTYSHKRCGGTFNPR
jgi:predicted SprT family Zn-dependent metalloprotease